MDPLELLSKLSLKQHAVMLAVLGGLRNARIAELMQCDRTIVSAHLNAALTHLRCTDRHHLAALWCEPIGRIADSAYRAHFGLSKRWFEAPEPLLMTLLRRKTSRGGARAAGQRAASGKSETSEAS